MKLKSVLLTFGLVFLLSATSVAAEEIAKEKEYIPPTAEQKTGGT